MPLEPARRVTKAYIRGLRDYVDAQKDQRLAGPGAAEIVDIIARYSTVKDTNVLRAIIPHYVDPDGRVNLESMRKDLQFFRDIGEFTDAKFRVEDIVDMSFVDAALRTLEPWR